MFLDMATLVDEQVSIMNSSIVGVVYLNPLTSY